MVCVMACLRLSWHIGMFECVVGSCLVGEHGKVSEHVVLDLVVEPPVQEVVDVAA